MGIWNDLGIVELLSELKKEIGSGPVCVERTYRVRRLAPLECWRLMGFSDEDFSKAEAVSSVSKLYKQAGNSIVKNVLMAVFGQMIPGKEEAYKGKSA